MAEAPFALRVDVVKRSRRRLSRLFTRAAVGFAVSPVALAFLVPILRQLGAGSGAFDDFLFSYWLFAWIVGTPLASVLAFYTGRRRREVTSEIAVRDEVLVLTDYATEERIPLRAIEGAVVIVGESEEVEISLAGGDALHVAVSGLSRAEALVDALGFGTAARRTVVPLGDPHDALAAGCWGVLAGVLASVLSFCGVAAFGSSTGMAGLLLGWIVGAVFVVGSVVFARLFTPGRVVIGTDGLVLEGAFRRRFFPLASIVDIVDGPSGFDLVLKAEGAPCHVTLVSTKGARAYAAAARIRDALHARRSDVEAGASALIARGGRPVSEWREALRRLVQGAGYRGERVSVDALLDTAGSAAAPAEQRVGAAMAIGMGDDADAKRRLRVVVEGIANEKLRVALAEAAEGEADEAAIEEAIAAEKKAARG
jgi:hypothetical protein